MHSNRSMSSTARPVLSRACRVARIGPVSIQTGSSPRTERWWIRARGVSPWSATRPLGRDQHRRGRVADLGGDGGGDPAAGRQRLEPGHLLQRGVARALVGGEAVRREGTGSISRSNRPSAIAVRARSCEASANSSISSRLMSHFSAIISAERNWQTSWSPYRSLPAGRLGERACVKPYCWPTSIAAEIGIADMFCTPPATTRSWVPGHHALGREVHRLLGGAALPVDGHAGHVVGQPGHQPGGAGDVAGLGADGVAAAHDHVVDGRRVDAGAVAPARPARARRGRRSAPRPAIRRACRPGCGRRRRCRPQVMWRSRRGGW